MWNRCSLLFLFVLSNGAQRLQQIFMQKDAYSNIRAQETEKEIRALTVVTVCVVHPTSSLIL